MLATTDTVDRALEWIMTQGGDAALDEPLPPLASSSAGNYHTHSAVRVMRRPILRGCVWLQRVTRRLEPHQIRGSMIRRCLLTRMRRCERPSARACPRPRMVSAFRRLSGARYPHSSRRMIDPRPLRTLQLLAIYRACLTDCMWLQRRSIRPRLPRYYFSTSTCQH